MKPYNTTPNPLKYNASEERIISNVMDTITRQEHSSVLFSKRLLAILTPAFAMVIVLVIILTNTFSPTTPNQPIQLSDFQNKKLAEISYISGTLIAADATTSLGTLSQLSTNQTNLEDNLPTINLYFDMLRVFLDGDTFNQDVVITNSPDDNFDTLMTFTSQGVTYQFFLSISESKDITGILLIGSHEFNVTGSVNESALETEITLEAKSTVNNDYVSIEYATESEDEIETEYQITSSINGTLHDKTIKIQREYNESWVEIQEGNNAYQLKKELENGQIEYELQYVIDGVEGTAVIYVETDALGVEYYVYQITEGDHESEVELDRPDYDDDNGDHQSHPTYIPYTSPQKI